ncbi:MAG TPA: peptidoglycan DD-metalloendopeptidase family protein [Sphingomonadaceae bacterium]|nr:peptidoglycan DD-metalloendopeptidase family protein [Sphingomonadaceae bacterium]
MRRLPRAGLLLLLVPGAGVPAARLIGAAPIEASREALAEARRDARAAAAQAGRLEAQAKATARKARRAQAAEAAAAARVRAAEAEVAAAEARVALAEQVQADQQARLATRRAPVLRLTAALQVMARRPPALALLQPGSITDMAHVRALLAEAVPAIKARTADLRADMEQSARLRDEAEKAATARRVARARLEKDRLALAAIEADLRGQSQTYVDQAMHAQDRALALGAEARDIVDLMHRADAEDATRTRLAALSGPLPRPAIAGAVPPLLVRSAPKKRPFRMPVAGRIVTGFGELSPAGIRARGLTLATAPNAHVIAPADGKIVYGGPFHGYGRIVIVDHGAGWTSVLTGLAALAVDVGDRVRRGDPIGRADAVRPTVTIELRHDDKPVDLAGLANG